MGLIHCPLKHICNTVGDKLVSPTVSHTVSTNCTVVNYIILFSTYCTALTILYCIGLTSSPIDQQVYSLVVEAAGQVCQAEETYESLDILSLWS